MAPGSCYARAHGRRRGGDRRVDDPGRLSMLDVNVKSIDLQIETLLRVAVDTTCLGIFG